MKHKIDPHLSIKTQDKPAMNVLLLFGLCSVILPFQDIGNAAAIGVDAPPPAAIIERGPNSRVWQTVKAVHTSNGTIWKTNSFQELTTGVCFEQGGQWIDSREVINIINGVGVANQGPQQIIFEPNLNTAGAVDALTPDVKRLRSHLMALSF